ncbi:MAG: Holliday junction resolvase RuvX [Actinomycetota bacterium]
MGAGAGRVLGLDLGDARIGVAISDPERRLAMPLGTIRVGQPPGELRAIVALVAEHEVSRVVLGHPRSMSGARGPSARHAEAFAEALRAIVTVPVDLHDERLTTVEAERTLRDAGLRGRERRAVVDRTAAAVILQGWLDANRDG